MTAQLQLESEKQVAEKQTFLKTLFKTKPDEQAILIWIKKNKLSKYFHNADEATAYAIEQSQYGDVYFGVCTVSGTFADNSANVKKRATSFEVVGCPALYLDIDYGNTHQKKNLPLTEQDAIALIALMPTEPTFIINSGNGLHAYWLFDKLVLINNEEIRTLLQALSKDWNHLLINKGKDFGYSIDSVYDLARVLRVPGTLNHKSLPLKPVTIIDKSDKVYTPQLLREYLDGKRVNSLTKRYRSGAELGTESNFIISNNPTLDMAKLEELCREIPMARLSWERTFKGGKLWSSSEWDMSLANYAAQAYWTDQEVVNLLIASRIKHNADLKLRRDYFERTLAKARAGSTPVKLTEYNSNHPNFSLIDEVYTKEECNDLGNARRFVRQHGQFVRYCVERKKWFVYDGKRWKPDAMMEVQLRAKITARSIAIEAANAISDTENKQLLTHAQKTKHAKAIKDMLSMAESELAIQESEFNKDKYLLNVLNGTVDLHAGKLRPHKREDYITKLIDIDYDPNELCPTWLSFLNRIMDDNQNLISFLCRAVGYSLTGEVNERAVFVLYGNGANGKSVFAETVLSLLGDYTAIAPATAVMKKINNANTNDLAKLRGARFVSVNETDEGGRIDESVIKAISGDDKLTARFLYGEFFEFIPEFKVWLRTNHKPTVRGTDEGIWDRLKLIPFAVRIPKHEQNKQLMKELQKELSGILAWAVRGCLEWQRDGLGVPYEVEQATNEYREEQNSFAQFIGSCCIIGENKWASSAALRSEYESYCKERGETPHLTGNAFAASLRALGCEQKSNGKARGWSGIGLLISQ